MTTIRKEFQAFTLTMEASRRLADIREAFSVLLTRLDALCPPGREHAIVKTKLEEACMFATRSVAVSPQFQAQVQPGSEQTHDELFGEYGRRLAEAEKDRKTLAALEAAGVDNWEGYSEAMRIRRENDEAATRQ